MLHLRVLDVATRCASWQSDFSLMNYSNHMVPVSDLQPYGLLMW